MKSNISISIQEQSDRVFLENKLKNKNEEIKDLSISKDDDTKIKEYNPIEIANFQNEIKDDSNKSSNDGKISHTFKIFINKKLSNRESNNNINNNISHSLQISPIQIKQENTNYFNNNIQKTHFINEMNYFKCYICENYYLSDYITLQIPCEHKFCQSCGKLFYEEKIEQGQFDNFQCGITKCNIIIPETIIDNLISKTHYDVITKKKEELLSPQTKQYSNANTENLILNKIVDFNCNLKSFFDKNKFQNILNYSLKNVCDINTNEIFFQYSKNKNQICPNCKEMHLYGKNTKPFVKCLNCLKKYCKYCFKIYEAGHIENDSKNRCKVFYRRIKENKNNNSCFNKFLQNILMLIGSFLIISTFFIIKMKKTYQNNNCSFLVLFKILLYFLLSLIFTPLSFLIIPYISIISCI
jgi:hypothetical protein